MPGSAGTPGSRIPAFSSREEEAEFWDTHEFTDFLDELKPVRVRASKLPREGITIRLDHDALVRLRERAQLKGVAADTLARSCILEQLAHAP